MTMQRWKMMALCALVAGRVSAWEAVQQPNLAAELKTGPAIKLEKVEGITPSDTCWKGPEWWLKNPDGETYDYVQFYYPQYMGPHELFVFDFKTGKLKRQFINNTKAMFHLQSLYPIDDKVFVKPTHNHQIWYYDTRENTFVDTGKRIDELGNGQWVATPDRQIWAFGNQVADAVNRMAVYRIDPKTLEYERFARGSHSKKENMYQGRYADITYDGDWLYVEMGNWPWVLMGINYKTRESRLIAETEHIHGDYSTINLGRPNELRDMAGFVLTIKDMKGHKGETLSFWLRDGELTPKTGDTPPWDDKQENPSHVSRLSGDQCKPPADIEIQRKGPSPDGTVRVWYRLKGRALEHAQSWASKEAREGSWGFFEFKVTFHPEDWTQAVPVGNELFMVASSYARYRLVDPVAGTSTLLGPVMSTKSTSPVAYNGKAYMAGYSGFQVWEYDPSQPWNLWKSDYAIVPGDDTKSIDIAGAESNPRQIARHLKLQSHTQTPNAGVVLAADGFLYSGGPISRIGNGGGIGWVNPETLEHGGEFEPFTAYRVAKMCTADGGRYVVISCIPANYDDANPDVTPERGMIFVLDTTTRTYTHRISDKEWFWPGGIADAGKGRIIGWAGRDKNGEEPGFIYGMDVKTGKILWRTDVTEGPSAGHRYRQPGIKKAPDGRIWARISGVMVRIHPEDGRIEIVGRPNLKSGNICWLDNGQAYSFSDTTLYRWPEKWNCKPSSARAN
jgi:hypothetical protein